MFASILILECFVMISSDGIEIKQKDEEFAEKAAADWKKRIISEGGFNTANEIDARGLLFLVSGFGIPNHVFENNDILDLIKASNVKGISTVLRRSIFLIQKVPELIDWMVKQNMEIEAVDLAYTFGLENKCDTNTILTTFFHNKIKDKNYHQLSELKLLSKCLESHNIDPSKLLPDFKINEKVQHLEKEAPGFISETTPKRKAGPKLQEPKRSRINMPRQQSPYGGPVVDHIANGGPYGRYPGQPFFSQPSSNGLMVCTVDN